MKNARVVTLVGYHGRRNFGDDIFLAITTQWLARNWAVDTLYVSGYRSSVPPELNGVKLYGFQKEHYRISRLLWLDIFKHALRGQALIFSAGSIFTIQPFFLAYVALRLLKILKGENFLIYALGVSVGPLKSKVSQFWGPRLFSIMDFTILRDIKSSQILAESGQQVNHSTSYDLALLWPQLWEERPTLAKRDRLKIGICLHPGAVYGQAGFTVDYVIQTVTDSLVLIDRTANLTICILVACSDFKDGDVVTSNSLRELLEPLGFTVEVVVYDGNDLKSFAFEIQSCRAVITSRMHVGVVAAIGGVPLLQLAYARKVLDFFQHSGLGTDYLPKLNKFTVPSITEFLNLALTSQLVDITQRRRTALLERRDHVRNALTTLAEFKKIAE